MKTELKRTLKALLKTTPYAAIATIQTIRGFLVVNAPDDAARVALEAAIQASPSLFSFEKSSVIVRA